MRKMCLIRDKFVDNDAWSSSTYNLKGRASERTNPKHSLKPSITADSQTTTWFPVPAPSVIRLRHEQQSRKSFDPAWAEFPQNLLGVAPITARRPQVSYDRGAIRPSRRSSSLSFR